MKPKNLHKRNIKEIGTEEDLYTLNQIAAQEKFERDELNFRKHCSNVDNQFRQIDNHSRTVNPQIRNITLNCEQPVPAKQIEP